MANRARSAYGGPGWTPRRTELAEELGSVWAGFSVRSEWKPLRAVLVHRPEAELLDLEDADRALMLEIPDAARAQDQHDELVRAYRDSGVAVHHVEPTQRVTPNQMFVADLMLMTPSGAIVGRPASTVRAGEERWVARKLAALGIPILRSVGGNATFEGADAAWLDDHTVLVGTGLRTNPSGVTQLETTLGELGIRLVPVALPAGSMHLMGELRIVDRDLAFVRPERTPPGAIAALQQAGFDVRPFPSEDENRQGMAHNFVTLGPRKILMPAGNPRSEEAFRSQGLQVIAVDVREIRKAAGAIGCLTGVLARVEG